jgi:hypothetical protein
MRKDTVPGGAGGIGGGVLFEAEEKRATALRQPIHGDRHRLLVPPTIQPSAMSAMRREGRQIQPRRRRLPDRAARDHRPRLEPGKSTQHLATQCSQHDAHVFAFGDVDLENQFVEVEAKACLLLGTRSGSEGMCRSQGHFDERARRLCDRQAGSRDVRGRQQHTQRGAGFERRRRRRQDRHGRN